MLKKLQSLSPVKIISAIVAFVLAVILLVNILIVVDPEERAVEVCLGDISQTVMEPGLKVVKPWCSYDRYNFAMQIVTSDDVMLPTQDRYDSLARVDIQYWLDPSADLPTIRKDYGTQAQLERKTLNKLLPNIVKSETRKLEDSKLLAVDESVSQVQKGVVARLNEKLDNLIRVDNVLMQDIAFDPKIIELVNATKKRREEEEREQSSLRIKMTQLQQEVEKNKAEAESAKYQAEKRRVDADAALYVKQKEAAGITATGKALRENPQVLEMQRIEVQRIEAEKWDGQRKLTHQIYTSPITPLPVTGVK
ncbi:lipoprotein [Vibrio phage EniLVp02]